MPTPRPVQIDPQQKLEINVSSASPHVLRYRLWVKAPGAAQWTVLGTGTSEDNIPDFYHAGPYPSGTELAIWMGFGGNPVTTYAGVATLSQQGKTLTNGNIVESGTTDDAGVAEADERVVFYVA